MSKEEEANQDSAFHVKGMHESPSSRCQRCQHTKIDPNAPSPLECLAIIWGKEFIFAKNRLFLAVTAAIVWVFGIAALISYSEEEYIVWFIGAVCVVIYGAAFYLARVGNKLSSKYIFESDLASGFVAP